MTPVIPADDMPDVRTFLLPSRAYLLSFRDQTLPARRAALNDSRAYFEDFSDEDHAAQLALLGLIGDALQVVEDVGVLGNALMTGFPGLSFYVKATAYSSSNVNDFYARAHKRDEAYFLRLAALRFEGTSVHDHLTFDPPLTPFDREAIGEAEGGTAQLLRGHLVTLARAWEAHRQFFHAYKHGALIANPQDVHVVRDREEVIARVAVWRRRRSRAEVGSHAGVPLPDLAAHVQEIGELALDFADYIVDTRLSIFDWVRITKAGEVEHPGPLQDVPWRFWLRRHDVEARYIQWLEERFGMAFE